MLDSSKNPYVGLRPYHSNESLYFFGREAQTLELLQRLHTNNFVAIVGSSGCGKSSLLRAGLIPALKGGFLVEDSNKWEITIMKPGESPMYNLADSLLKNNGKSANKNEITSFVNKIEDEGVDAILEHFVPLSKKSNINFFLLVDQFEELFAFTKKKPENSDKTINDSKNEAINFVNVLLELADQKVLPFYVVFTMRSDFIGDCSEYHGLPEAMNKSQYLVPRLNRQQLKKVIEGPSKLTGKKFNASLTSKLLNNLGDSQDELPILQHALMCMWEHDENDSKNKGEIDFADYADIGGLEKALSNHAQKALDELSKKDKEVASNLFRALTTVDGSNRKIRRQVRLKKLVELTGASKEKLLEIIGKFNEGGRSFLVIEDVGEFDDKLIDISHESLIRQWKALSKLVIQEARDAKQYKALSEKQKQYRVGDRDLLEGIEFEKAQHWWNTFNPGKTWAIAYDANYDNCKDFLLASKKKNDGKKIIRKRFIVGLSLLLISVAVYFINDTVKNTAKLKSEVQEKQALIEFDEPIRVDILLWENAKEDNTILAYEDYLETLPEGANAQGAKDSLVSKYNMLWNIALEINTLEGYETYLSEVTEFSNEDGETNEEYSIYAKNIEDAKAKIGQGGLVKENDPWALAMAENTVASYMNYINSENNEAHYVDAVAKLKKVGKRGWLFCGRKNEDKSKMSSDRVFELINRKGSFQGDDLLMDGDIIQLKGKAHRKIRASAEASSAGVGIVTENTNYFVLTTIGETAVFVEIIF